MSNEAIVFEIVNLETGMRDFELDNPELVKRLVESLDRKGIKYAVYRAKVAPLSNERWVKFMSMLCGERRDEVPFFHNGELVVSSEQPVEQRMRYWGGGEAHLRLVESG